MALLVYAFRMRSIFGKGKMGSSIPYLIVATIFFLLASVVALATTTGIVSTGYDAYAPGIRFVAFLFLFAFAVKYVNDWQLLGTH